MTDLHMPAAEAERLLRGHHAAPHAFLGSHPMQRDGQAGLLVRAMHPDATSASASIGDRVQAMERIHEGGLFATFFADMAPPQLPIITFHFESGATWSRVDPYSFWPTLGDQDLHLFGEGRHFEVWKVMGATAREHAGQHGTAFAVWAPNAAGVSVICDANGWDGRLWPMRSMGSSGIFELFVPDVGEGTLYQFEIRTPDGRLLRKADPYAKAAELPPGRASKVTRAGTYAWGDGAHMTHRASADRTHQPMNVYEVHLGSFRRHADGSVLNYRELADALIPHLQHFGFTHLELLPINEFPFDGSWGYQVTGFYAPTSRFGSPDDFRYLVDRCHQAGIEVIVDWVPAHFPKDDFALAQFDGTSLYEHADPRQGEHPDWGTLIFNYGRSEVQSFLTGSALYLLEELHVDGLRVDAVASMLYLDYSREHDQWVPNAHGGRENIEAVSFLRHLNGVIAARVPGAYTIAEESTSWGGVTAPAEHGGLGFRLKWNMGWMHDTLLYFARDPVHRKYHQHDLTFASVYEHSERFLMPLSHDEVVHGKGSLLNKMPGDRWQKFANLRALLTYQYTRPGKKLVFMGTEFAPDGEWDHHHGLPWPSRDDAERQAFMRFFAALGQLYLAHPALFASDDEDGGFRFIDASDHEQSVLSYMRSHGDETLIVVLNLTPTPHKGYRIGCPGPGRLVTVFDSDSPDFGGSQWQGTAEVNSEPMPLHGLEDSVPLDLPPLGVLVLRFDESPEAGEARRLGIASSFYTIDGTRHTTASLTRTAFVNALRDGAATIEPPAPIADPSQAYGAAEALPDGSAVGIWIQLYALHSERSWGIGDMGDLMQLIRWAAPLGLDFIGLNPLHATQPNAQPAVPYHPSTRLFRSPLYIDVVAVPEYRALCEAGVTVPNIASKRDEAREGAEVDYPRVAALKLEVLRACHSSFQKLPADHPRRRAFATFVEESGPMLRLWGIYSAIQEELIAEGQASASSRDFPEPLKYSRDPAVEHFAERHPDEVAFHMYLQWLVEEQLAQCAELARSLGMQIGLYLDMAVGSAHDGFDAWALPHTYVPEASLGAPPDELAPQGQDWGIVPLHPFQVLADGGAHFRALVQASMAHAGAMRIDHAMGVQRQFWIPREADLRGTYVAFPRDHLLDIIAQESRARGCLVVAEDLGTVPEGFRERLEELGILRYEVLQFARTEAGAISAPSELLTSALLCLSTHDLPTFCEYWTGRDLLLRRDLGLLDEPGLLDAVQSRMVDKQHFDSWLREQGLPLPEGLDTPPDVALRHMHEVLAEAPSQLLCLSLDDLTGEPHSVNVPGTTPESGFTSFARRMRKSLDAIRSDGALATHITAVVAAHAAARSQSKPPTTPPTARSRTESKPPSKT